MVVHLVRAPKGPSSAHLNYSGIAHTLTMTGSKLGVITGIESQLLAPS